MKKLLAYFILIFLSFNINAEISSDTVSEIKLLKNSELKELFKNETYLFSSIVLKQNYEKFYFPVIEGYVGVNEIGGGYKKLKTIFFIDGTPNNFDYKNKNILFDFISQYRGSPSMNMDETTDHYRIYNDSICFMKKNIYIYGDNCVSIYSGLQDGKRYLFFQQEGKKNFFQRVNTFLYADDIESTEHVYELYFDNSEVTTKLQVEGEKIAKKRLDKILSLIQNKTELQKAQNFLSDIKTYIKINPN